MLPKVPEGLANLAVGSRFEGVVTIEGSKTLIQVQTSQGTVDIQTVLPLAKGARLDLMLQMLSPRFQAQILTVDGKPPGLFIHHPSHGGTAQTSAVAPQLMPKSPLAALGTPVAAGPLLSHGAHSGNALIGATVLATVTRPVAFGAARPTADGRPGTPTASIPQTGRQTVPSAQGASPSAAPRPATTTPTPTPTPQTVAQSGPSAPGAPSAHTMPHPSGSQIAVRVVSVAPTPVGTPLPAVPTGNAPPVLAQGQILTGIVSGTTAGGQSLIHSAAGPIALATPVSLPEGSTVEIEILGAPRPPRPPETALPDSTRNLLLGREFPALEDALNTLREVNPGLAHQITHAAVPRPDAQLGATMLFFLSAVRGGDVRSWLGEAAIRMIERAKPGSLPRLEDEFRQMTRMARDPVTPDWRVALVPMLNGQALDQVRLMLRPDGDSEENGENGGQGTRFVIDLKLSKMGRIQLDGLVRNGGKRVDLIIRTGDPMGGGMRDDIRRIFREANATTDIEGDVVFQVGVGTFVELEPERIVELKGEVVV